jgi:hypothetical protein
MENILYGFCAGVLTAIIIILFIMPVIYNVIKKKH